MKTKLTATAFLIVAAVISTASCFAQGANRVVGDAHVIEPGTMQVWAEPFIKLRVQKIYNLFQDPFERADITSNTYWDWQINHIGQVYRTMDDLVKFAMTFKDFPSRSVPPSFSAATIIEDTLRGIKAEKQLKAAFPMLRAEEGKPKE